MIDYDPHDWRNHLLDIQGSMVRQICGRVFLCGLWSAVIWGAGYWLARGGYPLKIPETAHALMGAVLGLLLVFRTNASYDRFWEGRRLWGAIVNQSRNLVRMSAVWLAGDPSCPVRIRDSVILFVWAAVARLRATRLTFPQGITFSTAELEAIAHSQHPAVEISLGMSQTFFEAHRRGLVNEIQLAELERGVQNLIDHLGGCERINNTPLPFAYMVHLRRALILYSFTLPLALVERYDWGVIPVTLLISFILYGIEEIGVEIESPFGTDDNDLPLERICDTIAASARQLVPLGNRPSEQVVAVPVVP